MQVRNLKSYIHIKNIAVERTVSQIFDIGPVFFLEYLEQIFKKKKLPVFLDKTRTKVWNKILRHNSLGSNVMYMHTNFQTSNNIMC